MYNNVVESLVRVYQQAGYSTLRFNFRGVGSSHGEYGDGTGEQEDVRAALNCLWERGKQVIDLAGYSFGAWVNALTRPDGDIIRQMVMVSPPVAFLDFGSAQPLPNYSWSLPGAETRLLRQNSSKPRCPIGTPGAVGNNRGSRPFLWRTHSKARVYIS